jgi:hypothetical protein
MGITYVYSVVTSKEAVVTFAGSVVGNEAEDVISQDCALTAVKYGFRTDKKMNEHRRRKTSLLQTVTFVMDRS